MGKKYAIGEYPNSHKQKHQPGDMVGSYGMRLLKRTRQATANRKWYGLFQCGKCDRTSEIRIAHVARDAIVSCGCYAKQVRVVNGRKNGPANGRKTGHKNLAKIPKAILQANGHKTHKLHPAIMRENGAATSLALCKSKRDYCGVTYRSTWEVCVAASLRKAGLAFMSEPVIDLGDCSYRPDFYIPSLGLYLEVKGRQYEVGMKKFQRFARTHNALLLDKRAIIPSYSPCRFKSVKNIA